MARSPYVRPVALKVPPDASTVRVDNVEVADQLQKKLSTVRTIRSVQMPRLSNGSVVAINVRFWSDADTERAKDAAHKEADSVVSRFVKRFAEKSNA